jgi:hypothetical protein
MLVMTSLYRVEVFASGRFVSEHTVEAANALAAINMVEATYGEPPEVEYKTIHHEDGTKETALVVIGWHGYTFLARDIRPSKP